MVDIITWLKGCTTLIIQGDGVQCITKADPINLIIFIALISWLVWYIAKKKGKKPINKNLGSFVG